MQEPHEICCQHCYATYDLCSGGTGCVHDVQANQGSARLGTRGAAFVGFCERSCPTARPKGSRDRQYLAPGATQPVSVREAAFAALESADAAISGAVTVTFRSLVGILRRHGVDPAQIMCVVFDLKEGKEG